MVARNSIIYICTQSSPLLPIYRALSRNLLAPYHRLSLSPLTLLYIDIRSSFIFSSCPNHLNTLRSTLLGSSLCIPGLLRTSLLPTLFIRDTPHHTSQILNLKNIQFSSLSTSHIPFLNFTLPLCKIMQGKID